MFMHSHVRWNVRAEPGAALLGVAWRVLSCRVPRLIRPGPHATPDYGCPILSNPTPIRAVYIAQNMCGLRITLRIAHKTIIMYTITINDKYIIYN